jgi:hypothetical protein
MTRPKLRVHISKPESATSVEPCTFEDAEVRGLAPHIPGVYETLVNVEGAAISGRMA